MIAKLAYPLATASGKIAGLRSGYHARTNKKTGRVTIAKNTSPYSRHQPSEAQLEVQRRFKEARKAGKNRW